MKVVLAYPRAGLGNPDDVVEVDEVTGRHLLRDGFARLPGGEDGAPFDPSAHSVDDVLAYLEGAPAAERDRVLAAERAGRARVGIVGRE